MKDENKTILGIPVGTEVSANALIQDIWDPTTEEVFVPKKFLGLGWGINLHAICKKTGLLK